jgi:hypothetical protein
MMQQYNIDANEIIFRLLTILQEKEKNNDDSAPVVDVYGNVRRGFLPVYKIGLSDEYRKRYGSKPLINKDHIVELIRNDYIKAPPEFPNSMSSSDDPCDQLNIWAAYSDYLLTLKWKITDKGYRFLAEYCTHSSSSQ